MEKWNCTHCGEELLGAVNRCWKCGQRAVPPAPAPSVGAVLLAETATAPEVSVAPPPPQVVALTLDEVAQAMAKDPPRRGSPFAFEATLVDRKPHETYYGDGPYRQEAPVPRYRKPLAAQYPRNTSAIGGVVAAYVLGLASLVILLFSLLGGLTAALGVACAVWGLYCPKKELATVALVFCTLVLTLAAWMLGFSVYETYFSPTIAPAGAPLTGP